MDGHKEVVHGLRRLPVATPVTPATSVTPIPIQHDASTASSGKFYLLCVIAFKCFMRFSCIFSSTSSPWFKIPMWTLWLQSIFSFRSCQSYQTLCPKSGQCFFKKARIWHQVWFLWFSLSIWPTIGQSQKWKYQIHGISFGLWRLLFQILHWSSFETS